MPASVKAMISKLLHLGLLRWKDVLEVEFPERERELRRSRSSLRLMS